MKILGIDPGLRNIGWGILEKVNDRYIYVNDGTIITDPKDTLKNRLRKIYQEFESIILKYGPNVASIEDIYFAKNKKTAINVSETKGAIMLILALKNIDFYAYTPIQVKNSISGFGRIKKDQVKYMIRILLGFKLNFNFNSSHSADALALAFCHGNYTLICDF